jgi:hypothetical protein
LYRRRNVGNLPLQLNLYGEGTRPGQWGPTIEPLAGMFPCRRPLLHDKESIMKRLASSLAAVAAVAVIGISGAVFAQPHHGHRGGMGGGGDVVMAIAHLKLENEGWERDVEVVEPTEPTFTQPAA